MIDMMNTIIFPMKMFIFSLTTCASYKILAVFPYNGRSHHIFYSSLVEELASRRHEITVINYFPVKKMPNLYQISLQKNVNQSDTVNMKEHLNTNPKNMFEDFLKAYDTAQAFKYIANTNCERLVDNKEVQRIISSRVKYDLVIAEQFVTDCGLALGHKLNAPTVGISASVLMPWTYSRLGAPNNPAFVPNHFFGSGTKPDFISRLKGTIINSFFNLYYKNVIQNNDNDIVKRVYPEIPDLECLGRNMSLILLNQYFPLTGSRLQGANIIEIGGMHINKALDLTDEELLNFFDTAKNGVVYISFGSVATNFPTEILDKIMKAIQKSDMKFVWKIDADRVLNVTKNVLLRKWLPQPAILCHPKVVAFITHSGMLSTSEAMHCGVPIVSVPLFGDQFANAASAVENGLGVVVDLATIDDSILENALKTVLGERHQNRAKQLSSLWKDRPMTPMDTAVFWIEYVTRHEGTINMRPPTVDLPLYQYWMVDVVFILGLLLVIPFYIVKKFLVIVKARFFNEQTVTPKKQGAKAKKQD